MEFQELKRYIEYIFIYYYYLIALSKILSTLHVILHLVRHIPPK